MKHTANNQKAVVNITKPRKAVAVA